MIFSRALMDIRTSQALAAQDVIIFCSSHSCLTDLDSFVLWKTLGSGAQFSVGASLGRVHSVDPGAAPLTADLRLETQSIPSACMEKATVLPCERGCSGFAVKQT